MSEPTAFDVAFVTIETETAAAGFDDLSTVRPAEGDYPFRRQRLIEGEGIDPDHARVFRVAGNSMYPFLPDGSAILVDYQRTDLTDHCIFVYRTNGSMLVKRAKMCDQEWWWISDNPMGGRERVKPSDQVRGEVRWVGHALNHGISYGV